MSVRVPLGDELLTLSLPDCNVTVAEPLGGKPVDLKSAARGALESPHGPALREVVSPDETVAVVVTDVTRATPDGVLLEVLWEKLTEIGLNRDQLQVVIGLGLHRPLTDEEITETVGGFADCTVNHDPERTVEVGTVDGCPIELFEQVVEADVVLSTGMVEPHQYAGFSGGAKTVVIGAGGESQIRYSHGPEMLGMDGVRLGRIDENPFRSFLDRAGDIAGVKFCLNVTHGPAGMLGVAAGAPRAVVSELAATAREALAVEVRGSYDAIVTGVSAPKDANLYQASRAPTYVALGAHNPLSPEGTLVVPARLPEGAGEGTGEQRFFQRLSAAADAESLYQSMKDGYEPGAQRAFVVAKMLRDQSVTVTNSTCPELVEQCLMNAAPTVEDTIEPGSDVLVIPDALNTLLISKGDNS